MRHVGRHTRTTLPTAYCFAFMKKGTLAARRRRPSRAGLHGRLAAGTGLQSRRGRRLHHRRRRRSTASLTTCCWSIFAWPTATASTCWPIRRRSNPATPVIMITGYGTVETADRGHPGRRVRFAHQAADRRRAGNGHPIGRLNQREVIEENKNLKAQLDLRFGMENIVGHDHRMRRDLRHDRQRGRHQGHRADHRRKRHGQVADRPRHPSPQRPPRQAVRRSRLRRAARNAAGKRTVRPRGRLVHRRDRRQDRQVQAGRRRHDLPRRNQHRQPGHAGQAAPRAAGIRIRAGRRHQDVQHRLPRDSGHERRPCRKPWPKAASARTCTIAST